MKNITFLSDFFFHFLVVKFSVYLNRRVFVMKWPLRVCLNILTSRRCRLRAAVMSFIKWDVAIIRNFNICAVSQIVL